MREYISKQSAIGAIETMYDRVDTKEEYKEVLLECIEVLSLMESRKAIPVEWVKETIELAERVQASDYAEHLKTLLEDWEEENETD